MYKMPWAHVVRLLIPLCSLDFMYGRAYRFVLVFSAQIPNHAHYQIVESEHSSGCLIVSVTNELQSEHLD